MSPIATAMEAGGPMRKTRSESDGTIVGRDPNDLPHSGGLTSAIGRELHDDSLYAKTHAERRKMDSSESEGEKV